MRKLVSMLIFMLMCAVLLGGCGEKHNISQVASKDKSQATESQELIRDAQDNVKSTVGLEFMTIKLEDGTAYTWDKGPERSEIQSKIDKMLSTLKIQKVGVKKRPTHFVALLYQNISIIIPYKSLRPEKNILIENDEGTFIGDCAAENLQAVLEWLKKHSVKIG